MPFTLQQIVRSPSYNNLFQILQNHKKELIRNPLDGLNKALDAFSTKYPDNSQAIIFKLELLERYPSRLAQKFLIDQTKSANKQIRFVALKALAKFHLQNSNTIKDVPFRSYLQRRIEPVLIR